VNGCHLIHDKNYLFQSLSWWEKVNQLIINDDLNNNFFKYDNRDNINGEGKILHKTHGIGIVLLTVE
jgi:hypothetical protein